MRILWTLQGQLLPCRCVAGAYETYDGRTVWIIDARSDRCREALHRPGASIEAPRAGRAPRPADC